MPVKEYYEYEYEQNGKFHVLLKCTYGTAQVQGNVRTRLKRVLTASETRLPRV